MTLSGRRRGSRPHRARAALLIGSLVALSAASCGPAESALSTATVTDSAGVRTIRHDLRGVDVPAWRDLGEHDVEIGVQDGAAEYSFSGITDLAVSADGRFIVSDRVAQEVRVFDTTGVWIRTLGGRGEGPGEFSTAPLVAGVSGDTAFLFDRRAARVTPWTLAGSFAEPLTLNAADAGRPLITLRRDDGTYLVQSRWTTGGPAEPHDVEVLLDSVAITLVAADGALVDSLQILADMSTAEIVQGQPNGAVRVMRAQTPYTARAFLLSDGSRTAVAHSSRFDFGFLDPAGRIVLRLVVDGVQHPATRADIRRRQEERLLENLDADEVTPMVRQLNIEFAPERLQAFVSARFATNGDLWVALQDFDEIEGTRWLVFAPDGSLRGSVHTPERMLVRHIRPSYIVGIVTDDLDVPYVRRYPLTVPRDP